MKLVIILSIAALAACDYSGPQPETPSDDFGKRPEAIEETATIAPGKSFPNFKNFYQGAFPPARFPSANFLSSASFGYPLKAFNYASPPQSILPPISQVIPPQISQIVPPISQIVPPIFGNIKPSLPAPSPAIPSQFFPPVTKPLFNKFTAPLSSYPFPLYQFPSYSFPSTFSFPPSTFAFPTQKPPKTQPETLSTSYGPPASGPVEPEPAGQAESSAAFEPAPVSFPYEPAAPEEPEPAAPPKPAQEYGLPPSN